MTLRLALLLVAATTLTVASAGCTKKSCPFSYTNPDNVNGGRCGEVDAASRMPADIFKDPERVQEYVLSTTKWYHIDGVKLTQSLCDHTGRTQKGSENVSWTSPTLMKYTCLTVCNCEYPFCPDTSDVPRNKQYCSLCGPKFNAPIEVKFWYPKAQVEEVKAAADTTYYRIDGTTCADVSLGSTVGICPTSLVVKLGKLATGACAAQGYTKAGAPLSQKAGPCGTLNFNTYTKASAPTQNLRSIAASKNIVDLAVATPDLSTLVAALKAADLVDTLSGKGPFTVFAPTNEAFAALPAGVLANLLKPENKYKLVDILTYHVASGDVHAKDLTDREMIPTVEGKDVEARVNGGDIFINTAKVTAADNDASNGVVHIIDAVLIPPGGPPAPPPGPTKNIVELAAATPDLSTLVAAIGAAGLYNTLAGKGPFTVFAPTNEAFAALPAGVLANLLKPENKAQLVDILTYHVAAADVHAKDLRDDEMITTVEGKNVTARVNGDDIFINTAKVTAADNDALNGVVHIIDAVLMPGSRPKPPPAPPAPPANHLYFRGWTQPVFSGFQCGQVDAAPRIPAVLFDPSNRAVLKAYEDITIALYRARNGRENVELELGNCADNHYNISHGSKKVVWANSALMDPICKAKCHCAFDRSQNKTTLPGCTDTTTDPTAGKWCSLCGPTFNQPIEVNLFGCNNFLNPKDCPGPKIWPPPSSTAASWEQVVKDLMELL